MKFHITYEGNLISVELISKNGNIYSIEQNNKPVFFITCAKTRNNEPFWTSIPQGNEKLAQELGKLIEEHEKVKR
jgi:hypothetical protein